MTRVALLFTILAGGWATAPARADVEVAPPPREVRPDGARDPAPQPARREDPAETVDRIIKTSKVVGDKLAETDTGTDTRAKQDQILKDIDSLLNPPPQSGGGGGGNDKNDKNDKKDQDKNDAGKKNDGDPSGGSDGMPQGNKPQGNKKDGKNSSGGSDGMPGDNTGMPPPQSGPGGGGGNDTRQANGGEHRPRKGGAGRQPKDPDQPPPGGKHPDEGMAKGRPQVGPPMPPAQTAKADGSGLAGKMAVRSSLPLEDEVVKEVWGHLPDKLRQQVTQYYKEQFMPRYADLLKQYYSSLASTPQKAGEGRK